MEDESLPPPSDPEVTERWGTGGALFLPRKPPSRTPLFLTTPSAFPPSPPDPAPSPSSGCGNTLPHVTSWNGAVRRLSWRLWTALSLHSRNSSRCRGSCYRVGAGAGRPAGPELQSRGPPLAVVGPEVTERAADIEGLGGARRGGRPGAVQHPSTQGKVLEVSVEIWMDGVSYRRIDKTQYSNNLVFSKLI